MSTPLSIPLFVIKLNYPGGTATIPVSDPTILSLGESPKRLADRFAGRFQDAKLDKSDYLPLMNFMELDNAQKSSIAIAFDGAKDGLTYPPFTLEFDYWWREMPKGVWAIVPALGEEAMAESEEELRERLAEVIRLNFTRFRRLKHVATIVSTIWYEEMEMSRHQLKLETFSLTEQEELDSVKAVNWLEMVGEPLRISQQQVWFRDKELSQILRAVKNDFTRNVLLVGKSGVGKSALIWELARTFKTEKMPGLIWETSASRMIRQLMQDNGWEENMGTMLQNLRGSDDFLYIQNLLELFEVGQYAGSDTSMADVLNSYLGQGDISILSECTTEELRIIEVRSPDFLNHFQIIRIEEPTTHLRQMIVQKIEATARHRGMELDRSAIEESIRLNRRFTPYSGMPGRTIRFLESLMLNHQVDQNDNLKVGNKEILKAFSEETGLPLFMIDEDIPFPIDQVKSDFSRQVVGQQQAVESVINMLATVKTALSRKGKPIASYLFVGPTGVGKTELAKVLCEFMFGNRDRIIRFDMSEYSHPQAVQRLIGDSFYTDGLLTSAVRRQPFSVLLFDEIEKANRGFYDLLLQILDEGRLSDSHGQTVNFCSTIIIMTSNIGAANLQDNRISWKSTLDAREVIHHFESAVQKHFRPELYNRIDKIISFGPLSQQVISKIVEREIEQFKNREGIRFRNLNLQLDDSVYDFLSEKGYDGNFGARYLQRTIREALIIPMSRKVNIFEFEESVNVLASTDDHGIQLEVSGDELALDLWMEELKKVTNADLAGDHRRDLERLGEGRVYVMLESRLTILKKREKSQKEDFWRNGKIVKEYKQLLELKDRKMKLRLVIEELELQLSLIKMGLAPNEIKYETALDQWKYQFILFKKDLYLIGEPHASRAVLVLVGTHLQPILDFYLSIFDNRKYDWTASGIWFRESLYNQIVEDETKGDGSLKKAEKYLVEPIDIKQYPDLKPDKPEGKDLLCGVMFELENGLPGLFLRPEKGFHHYKIRDKESHTYCVLMSEDKKIKLPPDMFRSSFFKKPRRIVTPLSITDTEWKVRREVNKDGHLDVVMDILRTKFETEIDLALM